MGNLYEQQLLNLALGATSDYSRLAMDVSSFLVSSGYLQSAASITSKLLQDNILREDEQLVRLLNVLGKTCRKQGNLEEAVSNHTRAIEISRKLKNDELESVALKHLGSVCYLQTKYAEGVAFFRQSLAIKQQLYKRKPHRTIATVLNNMAFTLLDEAHQCEGAEKQRKVAESKEMLFSSLTMRQQLFGENHRSVATSHYNASVMLVGMDALEALKHGQKSLEIKLTLLGEVHPNVANCLSNLGYLCNELHYYDESIKYSNRALMIYKKLYGEDNQMIYTGITLNNIAWAYEKKNDTNTATNYYRKALNLYKGSLGEDHPRAQETKESLDRVLAINPSVAHTTA
jgi:tetratricopeptide (TPR) repeat protein